MPSGGTGCLPLFFRFRLRSSGGFRSHARAASTGTIGLRPIRATFSRPSLISLNADVREILAQTQNSSSSMQPCEAAKGGARGCMTRRLRGFGSFGVRFPKRRAICFDQDMLGGFRFPRRPAD